MPNVTFTLADNGQGPMSLRFAPRTLHTSGGEIVTPVPKPGWQTFARGIEHTVDLDEGPWQVHGLGGRNSGSIEPFDVGPTGGDLRALIAFGVPADTPATKLAAAAKAAVESAAFPTTSITYDGTGNVETVTENGVTTTYAYNADGTVATDARLGVTRNYSYDSNGNLTSITVEED